MGAPSKRVRISERATQNLCNRIWTPMHGAVWFRSTLSCQCCVGEGKHRSYYCESYYCVGESPKKKRGIMHDATGMDKQARSMGTTITTLVFCNSATPMPMPMPRSIQAQYLHVYWVFSIGIFAIFNIAIWPYKIIRDGQWNLYNKLTILTAEKRKMNQNTPNCCRLWILGLLLQ